jgi:microcin C transport system permease protein
VVARLIYGFRISVLFGLTLTIVSSSVIGVAAGAVQGYFGGWTDLSSSASSRSGRRSPHSTCCSSSPRCCAELLRAARHPAAVLSWVALVGVVRAEFLRGRNFEYVNAARALGVGNLTIMFRTCCRTRWWRR